MIKIGKNHAGMSVILVLCVMVAMSVFTLALVPSSPALKLEWTGTLAEFRAGDASAWALLTVDTGLVDAWEEPIPLAVTGYSLCLAAGGVLAVLFMAIMHKEAPELAAATAALSGLFALLGGHWMYCAVRWGYIVNDLAGDWSFPLQFWQGGFNMYGAILGAILGGVLAAKLSGVRLARTLDLVVVGALVMIAAGRVGEMFTSQGVANTRAAEALAFMPFTRVDEWGDPALLVWAYEALAAVIALIVCIVMAARRSPAGRVAEVGLAIISAWQLMFESMRGDELIRFGFVCLNMITAAAVLAFILVTRIIRRVRRSGLYAWDVIRVALFALGCGVVIVVEFALDGKIKMFGGSNTALYALDVLAVLAMMFSVTIADGRKEVA